MGNISKEFWVSDFDLEEVKKGYSEWDTTLSRNENKTYKNKITISYEIEREITIKESDLEKLLEPSIGFTRGDVNCLKEILFGGGEND